MGPVVYWFLPCRLKEELEKCMRLCGTPTLKDLSPRLVDARSVGRHTDCAPIPPSPYAYVPPQKSVRSPDFPTVPQEREKIKAQIAALTQSLEKIDRSQGMGAGQSSMYYARVFGSLMRVMLVSVLSTVFATSYSGSLHRSALFLLVFLVVHMLGNLTALFGRDAYNSYGHRESSSLDIRSARESPMRSTRDLSVHTVCVAGASLTGMDVSDLNSMPFIRLVELYLAAGLIVHLVTAAHFTYNKRKAIKKGPLTTGLLALTVRLRAATMPRSLFFADFLLFAETC